MLKCCYSKKKYSSKLKQHELPDALSKEFLFKCLSVMSYEQCIVSVDDSAKGGLTQLWELFTMIHCGPKYVKR